MTTGLSNIKIAEIEVRNLIPNLVYKFSSITGITPPSLPTVEFGKCGGADALVLTPCEIMMDNSTANNPYLLRSLIAHEVAHSVLLQSGIRTGIKEVYSNSFESMMAIGFKNSKLVIDNLPALLIIKGMEEAPSHQFAALCASEDAKAGYGLMMYSFHLYTPAAANTVSAMADALSSALHQNSVLSIKELLEGEWPGELCNTFCSAAKANCRNPETMPFEDKVAYYGRIFALSDAIQLGYDHACALNHEINVLKEFPKRVCKYVNDEELRRIMRLY